MRVLPDHLQNRVEPQKRLASTRELGSLERLRTRASFFERLQSRRTLRYLFYNLAASFPLEVFAPASTEARAVFQLNRLLRLADAPRCIRLVFALLEHHAKMEIGPLRMWLFFLIMFVAAHWAACGFFLASRLDENEARAWTRQRDDTTWAREDELWIVYNTTSNATSSLLGEVTRRIEYKRSVVHCYCRAYYWALVTMVTTGFGDIIPFTRHETITCILSMYFRPRADIRRVAATPRPRRG